MSEQQNGQSGYESGSFRESGPSTSSQGSVPNTSGGHYNRSGGNSGSNPYRNNAQANSGGFRVFNKRGAGNNPEVERDFSVDPPVLYRAYVGTGNAERVGKSPPPPEDVLVRMKEVMLKLDELGYTVRTSVFDGPQKVFMEAKRKEVILPWRGFAEHKSKLSFSTEEAKWLAKKYAAAYFDKLPQTVQGFLAMNVRLLCGNNLKSPARFMVTWSEDGCELPKNQSRQTGDQGHLIAIALDLQIPVFNFAKADAKERLYRFIEYVPT